MLIMMPLASAKMVQVSDLGAYRFVERMNFFAKALDPPVSIDEPLHVGMMRPDSPYDIYATGQNTLYFLYFAIKPDMCRK